VNSFSQVYVDSWYISYIKLFTVKPGLTGPEYYGHHFLVTSLSLYSHYNTHLYLTDTCLLRTTDVCICQSIIIYTHYIMRLLQSKISLMLHDEMLLPKNKNKNY